MHDLLLLQEAEENLGENNAQQAREVKQLRHRHEWYINWGPVVEIVYNVLRKPPVMREQQSTQTSALLGGVQQRREWSPRVII